MRIQAKIDQTEDIQVSMTITMNLEDWIMIAESLPTKYPSWQLAHKIKDVAYEIKKVRVESISDKD
jgi:hypothetical protein